MYVVRVCPSDVSPASRATLDHKEEKEKERKRKRKQKAEALDAIEAAGPQPSRNSGMPAATV